VIIDPVCTTAWVGVRNRWLRRVAIILRDTVVCGGGASCGDFAFEKRLRLSDTAQSRMPGTGFRVSFTLTAERPRP